MYFFNNLYVCKKKKKKLSGMDCYIVGSSGVLVRWSRYEEKSRRKILFLQAHVQLFWSYLNSTSSTKSWMCFLGSSSRVELPSKGLAESVWLMVWGERLVGNLMAPVLCMQRHRSFIAAARIGPSAPETRGLSAVGVLPVCCTSYQGLTHTAGKF